MDRERLGSFVGSKDMASIDRAGGALAICKELGSDPKSGIQDVTEGGLATRRQRYGTNIVERKPPHSFFFLFFEAMKDATILILLAASSIAIIIGASICGINIGGMCRRKPLWDSGASKELYEYEEPKEGPCLEWVEGLAVFLTALLVCAITAYNNWTKEIQFRKLRESSDDFLVKVWRSGSMKEIKTGEVCVGDLVQLDTGSQIPADGLLIEGNDVRVNESSLTGESEPVRIHASRPFLQSGCTLVEGQAKYVVTAVGPYSEWGKIITELSDDRPDTPLQVKLGIVAKQIGIIGATVASSTFFVQIIIWLANMGKETCFRADQMGQITTVEDCTVGFPGTNDKKACLAKYWYWKRPYDNFSGGRLINVVTFFIEAVTILVVAVPEGLPLAVTISLAYSVRKMLQDNNLVRVIASCETMGGANNICSDKTGTLTENRMTVTEGVFLGEKKGDVPTAESLGRPYLDILASGIAINSSAHIGEDGKLIGNPTEGSMLVMLSRLGRNYKEERTRMQVVRAYPFSSTKKRMSTLVRDGSSRTIMHTKGASEVVLETCSALLGPNGSALQMDESIRAAMRRHIDEMASRGLRTIGVAMKEMPGADERVEESVNDQGMVLVCIVGIKDPLRKEVPDAVKKCQRAGIKVRMVTGDNVLTAQSIARECGILQSGTVLEGPAFRKMDPEQQRAALTNLEVMARCSPQDKLTLVRRLKELGNVVAVTGDGTNDAPALKEADVGLSMGIAGTRVAQDASDIVILDDNFASIVKSVLWGRSVYDNIRRFLQFQLTVNVVALVLCFMGAITGFGTPLKAIQLLWVNLIMDSLGALALATEEPSQDLLERKPHSRYESLINGYMWRNIMCQAFWQVAFTLFLLWYGSFLLFDHTRGLYGATDMSNPTRLLANGVGKDSRGNFRDTVIYNSFVLSQICNEFNSRKIYNELNVFTGLSKSPIFLSIIVISVVVQFITVQFATFVFKTAALDGIAWAICIGIAFMAFPISVIQRLLPPFEFMVKLLGGNGSPPPISAAKAYEEDPKSSPPAGTTIYVAPETLPTPVMTVDNLLVGHA